jgi:uncharacterized protein YjbJ (UPF0337 family)
MKERRDSNDPREHRWRDDEDRLREQEKQRHLMEETDAPPDDGVVRDRAAESGIPEDQREQLDTDYDLKPALQKQAKEQAGESGIPMSRDIARWPALRSKVREQWDRFSEDEIDLLDGSYDRLIAKVQQRYGKTHEEAAREVNEFLDRFEYAPER